MTLCVLISARPSAAAASSVRRIGGQFVVAPKCSRRKTAHESVGERRHLDHHTERVGPEAPGEAVVGETVDGLGQVGSLSDGFIVAGSEAQLERQLHGADGHFPACLGDTAGEAPRKQDRCRTNQRAVDDLEVLVQDGESRIGARWERLEVEALGGPWTFAWEIPRAIRLLRGHEVPPEGRHSVVGPKSVARDSPACGTR